MARCFFARSFRALLWRNAIYRRRRWIPSVECCSYETDVHDKVFSHCCFPYPYNQLIEFFLPALCVAVLYFIKLDLLSDPNSSLRAIVVPGYDPGSNDTIIPLSFQDYVTALQAIRICVADPDASFLERLIGTAGYAVSGVNHEDWPVPFVYCSSYECGELDRKLEKEGAALGVNANCTYRTLALAPLNADASEQVERVLKFKTYVEERYPQITNSSALPFKHDFIQIFSDNDELNSYVASENYGAWSQDGQYFPKVAIAVVFDGGADSKTYQYTIRPNSTNFNSEEQSAAPVARTTPNTERVFDQYKREDSSSCSSPGAPTIGNFSESCTGQYILNGAVTIQRLVDDWILSDSGANVTVAQNGAVFVPMPSKEFTKSGFYGVIAPFAPLLFTLGLLYPVASTIRSITLEKELRQKELMKMMSVTECDIGWSWFVSFYAFFAPSGILTGVFTKALYSSSSFVWLLVFWQLSFIACIVYCLFIAALSTKATRATLIGIMLFFVGYFLPFIVNYQDGSSALITLLSIHPVTAYSYGLIMMGYLEDAGVGVQSTTITRSDFPSGYTYASSLSMLIVDSILFGVLSWYFNRILRGDLGTPLNWYFPLTRQYWCPSRKADSEPALISSSSDANIPSEDVGESIKKQQPQGSSIQISSLRKQFGETVAVDNLTLSMYSGQVTALLGHNGAGKTTTIGMLTGMIPPDSGHATVAGCDIRDNLSSLREDIGVCLQHDCLFPQLTVLEHVVFFSKIKGLYAKKSQEECVSAITTSIEDVALGEKLHSFAKDLSGGMKRKLSVAIAFCGDSKVIFLDEPTSGMDPFSRRFTWNVIRSYRENRCIVLTTHFMDEADILGDRIAIMAEGQLRCVGSSLFLKKAYGVGYNLTIIKRLNTNLEKKEDRQSEEEKEEENDTETRADLSNLESVVTGAVPSATVLSNAGSEISFQLPIRDSDKFVRMFEELDNLTSAQIIESYGVSITTLDEVFLKVARGERVSAEANAENVETDPVREQCSLDLDEGPQFQRHLRALFAKRAKNFKRDKKAWFCSIILPTIASLAGFLIVNIISRQNPNFPELQLSLDQNNPEITRDRNPIPFNNPGVYECQPGNCIYGRNTNNVAETSELYYFCGTNAQVSSETNYTNNVTTATCSIDRSRSLIDKIWQHGAFGVGNDVSDVLNSSKRVGESASDFHASQYGGIFFTHDEQSVTSYGGSFDEAVVSSCVANTGSYLAVDQCSRYGGVGFIVNYNFTSLHSSLLYQAIADEALMREFLNDTEYRIDVSVWPLPITQTEDQYRLASNSFAAWFLLVLSFPFIAGSFATFIVAERESKAKHLQTVAGVQPYSYWLSTYCWDIINYQIPLWTVIALMYTLDVSSYITNERQAASSTFAILILFGPAAAGFTYILCFKFKSPSMANLFVIVFNFFVGMAGPLVSMILRLLAADIASPKPHLKTAAVIIEWILRFVPSFCLGRGLLYTINVSFFEYVEAKPLSTWSGTVALYDVIFLGLESIFYILLTVQIDVHSTNPRAMLLWNRMSDCLVCKFFARYRAPQTEGATRATAEHDDEDVTAENERVRSGRADNDLIVLSGLSKVYPNGKRAVNNMTFGIPPGQCFGLLGINGAGKTTCMSILTAEFPPTSGDAVLAGYSVKNEPEKTRRCIGYCPQFDAHFANMTGREHVELYAIVKGVRKGVLNAVVAAKLKEVGLSEADSNRLSSEYSGGMKRKLSVACATVGSPRIGMDPVSRRELWKVISRMIHQHSAGNKQTSVIITTHSMEECEALCPRIGIMAGGNLCCLGSAQHLKNRFGQGYQLELKVSHAADEDGDVIDITKQILKHLNVLPSDDLEVAELHRLADDTRINLEEVVEVCSTLTGDDYLSGNINSQNHIYKLAISEGVTVDELVGFCTEELRVRAVVDLMKNSYPSAVLRERQDVKVRLEINTDGVAISSVFDNIEKHRELCKIEDYGVSQTSLEQVFNRFAEIAECEKGAGR